MSNQHIEEIYEAIKSLREFKPDSMEYRHLQSLLKNYTLAGEELLELADYINEELEINEEIGGQLERLEEEYQEGETKMDTLKGMANRLEKSVNIAINNSQKIKKVLGIVRTLKGALPEEIQRILE